MAALTRDRILHTAVRLADRDGPDAVTLRKIAAELGVHVTSLYNHVPARDAVTDGIVELLLDEAKLPTGPVAWDDWIRQFVDGVTGIAQPDEVDPLHHAAGVDVEARDDANDLHDAPQAATPSATVNLPS